MKIVQIGAFKNLWDEEGIARSFEKLGHVVLRIPEVSWNFDRATKDIEEFNPDVILVAKLKIENGEKKKFCLWAKEKKYKIVSWTFDLYFGLPREYWVAEDPIFKMDYAMGPDGGHTDLWRKHHVNYKVLRQGIFDEFCYKGEFDSKYDYDVIFVGCESSEWKYRVDLCRFLAENYPRFKWFGRKDTLEVRGDELNKLYASAKIVIGDSVYTPHYWSNRLYETIGRGGFMIHPLIEGITDEYKQGEHFITYRYGNFESLKTKIDYYLNNEKERLAIAESGLKHTKENHTLLNRCQQFLNLIQ